jgi:hypothetical protein
MALAAATPNDHGFISEREKRYIIEQTSASTSAKIVRIIIKKNYKQYF